jgi:NitT/TauT family transport system substrate-binding protein
MALPMATSCTQKEDPLPLDRVTLQLKWLHQSQFAGFYMAQEKGYYADERLQVTFLEGGHQVKVLASLLSGKADFSVVSSELVLTSRQKEKAPVTAIAAIYRKSAVVYAAMAESGIVRPSDFIGRTAAVKTKKESVREFEYQFNAMLTRLGLDISQVELVPYDPSYEAFYSGDVDITAAYYTGGVIHIRSKGHLVNLIWPSDYGIHFYSDTLITTDRMILTKPEVVERFLRASLRGWREAVGDPDAAVAATMKYASIKDRNLQTNMMTASIPLVHTGRGRVGLMEAGVWRQMHQVMVEQEILEQAMDDVSDAYTTRFLERIYGDQER